MKQGLASLKGSRSQKSRTCLQLESLEDRLVPTTSLDFVRAQYGVLLGRAADANGAAGWVAALESGKSTASVAADIFRTGEHRSVQVAYDYSHFFHRTGSSSEIAGWVSKMTTGTSEQAVALSFLSSAEYSALHADNASFVGAIYSDVLYRAADAGGLATWSNALAAGTTRSQVAQAFLTSAESYQVTLKLYYNGYLGREADSAGSAGWLQQLTSGSKTTEQVAIDFLASGEFFTKANAYLFATESFVEPPVLTTQNGFLDATLTGALGTATIDGRQVAGTMTYNGSFPAPTLSARPGEVIRVTINNQLPPTESTNLHVHGLHVSPLGNGDNVFLDIAPGEKNQFYIQVPADHPQGTYWFHPHMHELVDGQLYRGLAGFLIIGNPNGGSTELAGMKNRLIGLKNIQIDANNTVVPTALVTPNQQIYTVNGVVNPTITLAPGESQVFNVANLGNEPTYQIDIPGQKLLVVAEDGQPLTQVRVVDPATTPLTLPPGKRYSIIVQGGLPGTTQLMMRQFFNGFQTWPERVLATIVTQGVAVPATAPPTALTPPSNYFEELRNATVAAQRQLVFDITFPPGQPPMFTINGQVFPNVPLIEPVLNTVEEWTLLNNTTEIHPFHIHVNNFQVVSINDQPVDTGTLQDTVPIPAAQNGKPGKVVIRMRFEDFVGAYVYHCHILFHEDHGMMGVVNVIQGIADEGNMPPGVTGDGTGHGP